MMGLLAIVIFLSSTIVALIWHAGSALDERTQAGTRAKHMLGALFLAMIIGAGIMGGFIVAIVATYAWARP